MKDSSVSNILQLAFAAHRMGQLADAERLYRQVLTEEPRNFDALRFLGTARLKGLDPTPLVEIMVFEQLPPGAVAVAPESRLQPTLLRLAGADREPADAQETTPAEVDKRLCVVSVLEDEATRTWYIGRFEDEVEALLNAFRVKLAPVGLKDGEPFESWLFQRRGDLAMLYQGLRGAGRARIRTARRP